jgi:hypothetical protein
MPHACPEWLAAKIAAASSAEVAVIDQHYSQLLKQKRADPSWRTGPLN